MKRNLKIQLIFFLSFIISAGFSIIAYFYVVNGQKELVEEKSKIVVDIIKSNIEPGQEMILPRQQQILYRAVKNESFALMGNFNQVLIKKNIQAEDYSSFKKSKTPRRHFEKVTYFVQYPFYSGDVYLGSLIWKDATLAVKLKNLKMWIILSGLLLFIIFALFLLWVTKITKKNAVEQNQSNHKSNINYNIPLVNFLFETSANGLILKVNYQETQKLNTTAQKILDTYPEVKEHIQKNSFQFFSNKYLVDDETECSGYVLLWKKIEINELTHVLIKIFLEPHYNQNTAEKKEKLKSNFLTSFSHEIRTPMSTIVGFAELLIDSDFSPEKRAKYLKLILQNARDLLGTLDRIIDVSKLSANELRIYKKQNNINTILKEIFDVFEKYRTDKHLQFQFSLKKAPAELEIINTDDFRLRQVFNALIENAFKYTETGKVSFGFEKFDENGIYFFVQDTGQGIKPENIDTLFNQFETLETNVYSKNQGIGLGLSMTQKIVELLGGNITLESKEKEGTKFIFSIS